MCIAMNYAIDILEKVLFSKSLNSYRITSDLARHSCKFIGVGQRHEDFLENITGIGILSAMLPIPYAAHIVQLS